MLLLASHGCSRQKADIVLLNGELFTMDENNPWAASISITGNIISGVYSKGTGAERDAGPDTRVIDLKGAFVVPGFIDGHVHFNSAGGLINDANLMKVADDEGLRNEISRVVKIVGEGEWITGGLWGAYEEWTLGAAAAGDKKQERWKPSKEAIDEITPSNPCFLNNFDNSMYLANSAALRAAGLDSRALEGMEKDRVGMPTGLIYRGSPAIAIIRKVVKPKSEERMLGENRAALRALAAAGITEIHDIATPAQTERFVKLYENGELTCRVWLRPDLSLAPAMKEQGFTMGVNPSTMQPDNYIRLGALKGYIDGIMGTHGALFFEPYDDQPDNYGHYRTHTSNDPRLLEPDMDKMYNLIKTGYEAGFVSNVHAIGDKGVSLMLDTYERLMKDLGRNHDGVRVIHAQVIRPEDFPRFRQLNVIAEVNPYHVSDDMRWMEERIGHERCRGAYACRSLLANGAILSFGSDWPGTSAAEYLMHPRNLIHAAVNRTTLNHEPEGGWFPEEKISVEEALKAYTINNAYAAFDAEKRGSLVRGRLADITVCDLNLMKCDPGEILNMNVLMTIVDGKIVFEK
jgi:predicted amidohydrolase YtcJ